MTCNLYHRSKDRIYQQGKYTVEDLNALNKTRLNGVILAPHEERTLKDG